MAKVNVKKGFSKIDPRTRAMRKQSMADAMLFTANMILRPRYFVARAGLRVDVENRPVSREEARRWKRQQRGNSKRKLCGTPRPDTLILHT